MIMNKFDEFYGKIYEHILIEEDLELVPKGCLFKHIYFKIDEFDMCKTAEVLINNKPFYLKTYDEALKINGNDVPMIYSFKIKAPINDISFRINAGLEFKDGVGDR